MRSLSQIQENLCNHYGPKHYYTTDYHKHELGYIGNIPRWIRDSQNLAWGKAKILDIGPGYGLLAAFSAEVTGSWTVTMDRVPFLTREVCLENRIQRLVGDIERDKCPSYSPGWDMVIMTEVLEHFNFNPIQTLKGIRAEMAPTGALFLSTPDSASWGRLKDYVSLSHIPTFDKAYMGYDNPKWLDKHIWQYSEDELRGVLSASGFKIELWEKSVSAGGGHFNVMARP